MDFKPRYFKSLLLSYILTLESVQDFKGHLFYPVSVSNGVKENRHYMFRHLTSAIDFIQNNFSYEV